MLKDNDTLEDQKWLNRIRRQVAADTSYGMCFFDLKFLLGLFDRETERLKNQDSDIIIQYAIELQQSREENERLKNEIKSHGPEGRNYTNAQYVELRLENERLRGELAAKDKVLEWYGKPQHYYNWPSPLFATDQGQRARTILKRYERGDNTDGDVSQASSDLG